MLSALALQCRSACQRAGRSPFLSVGIEMSVGLAGCSVSRQQRLGTRANTPFCVAIQNPGHGHGTVEAHPGHKDFVHVAPDYRPFCLTWAAMSKIQA